MLYILISSIIIKHMHQFMCMHMSDFLIGLGIFSCLLYALLKTVMKYYYY